MKTYPERLFWNVGAAIKLGRLPPTGDGSLRVTSNFSQESRCSCQAAASTPSTPTTACPARGVGAGRNGCRATTGWSYNTAVQLLCRRLLSLLLEQTNYVRSSRDGSKRRREIKETRQYKQPAHNAVYPVHSRRHRVNRHTHASVPLVVHSVGATYRAVQDTGCPPFSRTVELTPWPRLR